MESLKSICRNWGNKECHPDVSKWKSSKEIEGGENIPIAPVGKELKRLDEICKNCRFRSLNLEEEVCPNCGKTGLVEIFGAEFKEKETIIDLSFTCKNCEYGITL